jgi:hypothetical protein
VDNLGIHCLCVVAQVEKKMDLPSDILVIVAQYAVTSLFDLGHLSRAGLRAALDHPQTLAFVRLEFPRSEDMPGFNSLTEALRSGVRSLQFEFAGGGLGAFGVWCKLFLIYESWTSSEPF